jgi:uncharacterized protein
LVKPSKEQSFFLFGARGVGKSTFLEAFFEGETVLRLDLLNPELEEQFLVRPSAFEELLLVQKPEVTWVVLDEVQKVPKLLNTVHKFIYEKRFKF